MQSDDGHKRSRTVLLEMAKIELVDAALRHDYEVWRDARAARANACAAHFGEWLSLDSPAGPTVSVPVSVVAYNNDRIYIDEIKDIAEADLVAEFKDMILRAMNVASPRWFVAHELKDGAYKFKLRLAPKPATAGATAEAGAGKGPASE